jgi:hypothetical protein
MIMAFSQTNFIKHSENIQIKDTPKILEKKGLTGDLFNVPNL